MIKSFNNWQLKRMIIDFCSHFVLKIGMPGVRRLASCITTVGKVRIDDIPDLIIFRFNTSDGNTQKRFIM